MSSSYLPITSSTYFVSGMVTQSPIYNHPINWMCCITFTVFTNDIIALFHVSYNNHAVQWTYFPVNGYYWINLMWLDLSINYWQLHKSAVIIATWSLFQYKGILIIKIRWSWDSLLLIIGIPILITQQTLYWNCPLISMVYTWHIYFLSFVSTNWPFVTSYQLHVGTSFRSSIYL